MLPYPPADPAAPNQLTARITAIEFTGYVTRVSLMVEATGQEITYKVRSSEWVNHAVPEGQLVTLSWAVDECIFLSH
jgi:putative spermidine/putrescine transport system ATP-binding protein